MRLLVMVRHLLIVATVLVGSWLLPVVADAAPPAPPGSVHVMAPPVTGAPTTVRAPWGLRLREGPSLTDRTLLILKNGEKVYPAAGPVWNQGISWSYVVVYRSGYPYEGFCASAYLANYGGYAPSGESGLKVIASSLRLRSCPGTWCRVQRVVPYGTILQPTGTIRWAGGLRWTEVSIDGVYLWAASRYLVMV